MTFNHANKSGFTILETMVAISILLIAITGPLSTIGTALSQVYTTRDQMIALNLAQEGIEAVRQVRDSNVIAHWQEGAATAWIDLVGMGYFLDKDLELSACLSACTPEDQVVYKTSDGTYYQGSGGLGLPTNFSREITMEDVNGDLEKKLTARVTWETSMGVPKEVIVTEYLFAVNAAITP